MSLDHTPQRVVSLQPSATVILAAIGKLDRLVACTKYCVDVCPEVATGARSIIADSWTAKADEILKSGTRFLGLAPKTLADIYTDIATIAGMLGVPERGEAVITEMQSEIEAIRGQIKDQPVTRPRVFCEEWGKPLISSQGWVAELVEAAGGEFIGEPGKQRAAQAVLYEDPEVF